MPTRKWSNYDPRTNTFWDEDNQTRVKPDGTPAGRLPNDPQPGYKIGDKIPTEGGLLIVVGMKQQFDPSAPGGVLTVPEVMFRATKEATGVSATTEATIRYNTERDRIDRERADEQNKYNRDRQAALDEERKAKDEADRAERGQDREAAERWRQVGQQWAEKKDTLDRDWAQRQFNYKQQQDTLDRKFQQDQLALRTGEALGKVGGELTLGGRAQALSERQYLDQLANQPGNFLNYSYRVRGLEPPVQPIPGAQPSQVGAGTVPTSSQTVFNPQTGRNESLFGTSVGAAPSTAGLQKAGWTIDPRTGALMSPGRADAAQPGSSGQAGSVGATVQPVPGAPITTSFSPNEQGVYPNGVVQSTTLYPKLGMQPGGAGQAGSVGATVENAITELERIRAGQ